MLAIPMLVVNEPTKMWDPPESGLDLTLSDLPGEEEGPCQIHSQDLFPVGEFEVHSGPSTLMARGMEQDVDRSDVGPGVGDPLRDGIDVGEVERCRHHLASRGGQLLDRFRQVVGTATDQHYLRPGLTKRACHGLAQAPTGAGHDGGPAIEIEDVVHRSLVVTADTQSP